MGWLTLASVKHHAIAHGTCEVLHMKPLLVYLETDVKIPFKLYEDNQVAITQTT